MSIEKYYNKEGKVGVLVSPGYGAGWSTWAVEDEHKEFLLFDKTLIEMCLNEVDGDTVEDYLEANSIDGYCGGWDDCVVKWVDPGARFRIEEYDGSECLCTTDDLIFTS